MRETIDGAHYYPITDDLIGFVRVQGGRIDQIGHGSLPLIDNFNVGPSLVRGFAPGGIGPRDISDPNNIAANSLGGTTYIGGTAEVQFPIFGLPREIGLKGALFADAGTLTGFSGRTTSTTCSAITTARQAAARVLTQPSCLTLDDEKDYPHLDRRQHHLGLAARPDPHRPCLPRHQGQIRPDAVHQLLRRRHF